MITGLNLSETTTRGITLNNDYYNNQSNGNNYPVNNNVPISQTRTSSRTTHKKGYVRLVNPTTGEAKDLKLGVNWLGFFFGPFIALYYKDWNLVLLSFLVYFVGYFLPDTSQVSSVYGAIGAFYFVGYNSYRALQFYKLGYYPKTPRDDQVLRNHFFTKRSIKRIDKRKKKYTFN